MVYTVDTVSAEAVSNFFGRGGVTLVERRVLTTIHHRGAVQSGAMIELVRRKQVVVTPLGVSQD